MDSDEYEYLEKTTEEQLAKTSVKDSNGSAGGTGCKRRSQGTPESGGDRHRRSHSGSDSRDRHRRSLSGSGSRDRHRRSLSGSGSRDRHRDRDRERRHRSRSRDDRGHRSSGERRDRERRHEEYDRGRESGEREREGRRHKKEKIEPEADPERDQRTVFAYQLPLKADERHVYDFFSKAGKVRDVRLIMDRNSRRSKGVGYIEFYDAMSVPLALTLSNQTILGQPVMVKPSEAEKNLVPSSAAAAASNGPFAGGARRLYVGNLHFSITEEQVKQVFESFGPVELVQMPRDTEGGPCKGYGFIQFARLEDAKAALHLNGQIELAGRKLKVSSVTEQSGASDVGATAIDFQDDDGGGLSFNASSRAMLMAKLDRTGTVSSTLATATPAAVAATAGIALPAGVPASVVVPGYAAASPTFAAPLLSIGDPTECLLLTNMFDPTTETEPDFDLDIEEDVHGECSKYGVLKHIFVDKNSAGHVYLRFGNVASAATAQRNLHGRWFDRKAITATFMAPQSYEAKLQEFK